LNSGAVDALAPAAEGAGVAAAAAGAIVFLSNSDILYYF